ncbi:MAG: ROK family transcriptional regulator [Bifidobacteriaceae bacterium]|jgi:predicted NBD/HSP70 family sugar kinase|nr:ROK family transcriptional regulator [Bifidobacteriaceae bacterium]
MDRSSRADVAAATGLSIPTVNVLVSELIADGVLIETGQLSSSGGRPAAQLGLRPDRAFFLGADAGERGVTVELFDLRLARVDRERRENVTRLSTFDEVAQAISRAVEAIRGRNPAADRRLVGMGFALPGIVEGAGPNMAVGAKTTLHAQNLGWEAPVAELAAAASGLRLYADNGAKAMATAEMFAGAASAYLDALVVLLGGGVGLGMVVNGRLVRGPHASAGEWGHTKVADPADPESALCSCGARGCLEAYVGEAAMVRTWRGLRPEAPEAGWQATEELLDQARAGDQSAAKVVRHAIRLVGRELGNLVNLTNPQVVVLGGRVGLRFFRDWRDELMGHIRSASLVRPGQQFQLAEASLGDDAIALGAAMLPYNAFMDGLRPGEDAVGHRSAALAPRNN